MDKILFSIWPYRGVRIILALIFLWAGVVKILDPDAFAIILEAFDLLPYSWIMPVAVVLPILEILAAIGLLQAEKVAMVPGTAFGANGAGFCRACFATGYDQLIEATDRIERHVQKLASKR